MQDQAFGTITIPSLDLPAYFHSIAVYFSDYVGIFNTSKSVIGFLMGVSIPLCFLLCIGIFIATHGLRTIRKREEGIYNPVIEIAYDETAKADPELGRKWEKILALSESKNESDWRQAIIEADIILGELLTHMGYKGETIGEQMKRVERGDFKTLAQASEAHHVRNRLAHDGSDYPLSQSEARRIIGLYRDVFEEFFYI